jgi:hypothetical protein
MIGKGPMSSDSDEERDNRDERKELPPTLRAMTGRDPFEPGPHGSERPRDATEAVEPAALRDAEAIAARVAADERAADAERDRLTAEPLPVIDAQADMLFQLEAGEHLHAERRAALIERGQEGQPFGGKLYLTSHRLVHIGTEAVEEVRLDAIADMAVALERLLLIELADGSDLAIEVDGPRLLRVQVAAARAALRERGG